METYLLYFKTADGYWKVEVKANDWNGISDDCHINIPIGSLIIPISEEEFNIKEEFQKVYAKETSDILFKNIKVN